MGAAAGAAIVSGNFHDPHRPCKGFFRAVGDGGQLLRAGIPAPHGQVLPHCSVGLRFDFRQHLRRNHPVKVDGDDVRAHVKAGVVAAVAAVQDTGDDMLPGMLLHPRKAQVVVDHPRDLRARFQGRFAQVNYRPLPLPGTAHPDAVQGSRVPRLTAALGVKGGSGQRDLPSVRGLRAGKHRRCKAGKVRIFIIKLACFHIAPRKMAISFIIPRCRWHCNAPALQKFEVEF